MWGMLTQKSDFLALFSGKSRVLTQNRFHSTGPYQLFALLIALCPAI